MGTLPVLPHLHWLPVDTDLRSPKWLGIGLPDRLSFSPSDTYHGWDIDVYVFSTVKEEIEIALTRIHFFGSKVDIMQSTFGNDHDLRRDGEGARCRFSLEEN